MWRDIGKGEAREVEGSSLCRRNGFSGISLTSVTRATFRGPGELQLHGWMAWVTTEKTSLALVDSHGLREDQNKARQANLKVRDKLPQGL